MADFAQSGAGDSGEVFKWTEENTKHMLLWRTANSRLFTGKRNAALIGFETYIEEAGLKGKVKAVAIKRKWENFVAKYKNLKSPRTGVSPEGGVATAASWKWYKIMDEATGARLRREKEEEEKGRERERLERLREAQYREERRAERERERMECKREMLEERARWEREKAEMLERWQEERQQSQEREERLMALLEMALKK